MRGAKRNGDTILMGVLWAGLMSPTNTSILHDLQHRGLSACLSQLCAGSLPTEEMCCNILEWPIDLNWARIKPKLDSSPLIEGPR